MTTLSIGLIGAAAIAPVAVIEPAALLPEVNIVAVAARGEQRAACFANAHGIRRAYGAYGELIADDSVDAVYIATPNTLHSKWVLEALRAGKHVLCEKPLAMNAEQAKQIQKAASAANLIVSKAFHYYYHPAFRRVLEVIRSGELGELRTTHIEFHFDARPRTDDIRWAAELGGGALLDLGCYAVHAARTIFGSEPLTSIAKKTVVPTGVDGAVRADMSFGPGRAGTFSCSLTSPQQRSELTITGSKGSLSLDHPFTPHWGHHLRITTSDGTRVETAGLDTTYFFQLKEFAAAALGLGTNVLPLSDAVANSIALDMVSRAASGPAPSGNQMRVSRI